MTRNGFEIVARVSDVPDQGALAVTRSDGQRVCLIRRGSLITAIHDVCTHQEFSIALGDVLSDGTIQCAWHGARFDCSTGEVRQIPADEPIPVYEVRIDGRNVLVGGVRPRTAKGFEPSIAEIGK